MAALLEHSLFAVGNLHVSSNAFHGSRQNFSRAAFSYRRKHIVRAARAKELIAPFACTATQSIAQNPLGETSATE
jgi:hypothetical protein